MLGKVPPDVLAEFVLERTGAPDEDVVQGPAYGEDTGAVRIGDQTLVVNPDPISLAVGRIGTLGVAVACNDVAASGATPEWLTTVVFLPDDDPETLDEIARQVDREADRLDVSVVAGHTEYAPALEVPMLVMTCIGRTKRYVPSGGARPGDDVILTKGAAVEGTAILATDFAEAVAADVPADVRGRAEGFYEDISVLPEAAVLAEYATAMHDPTEGGLVDGLLEMAVASDVILAVDRDAVPVAEETRQLCEAAGVDPFRIFGSGALVAAVPPSDTDAALSALGERDIQATVVGTVSEADTSRLELGDETFREPVRDDMYALWE